MEQWKEIAECPGYEVSSLGRVRKVHYMTPCPDADGYMMVCLSVNQKQRNIKIHRLVAKTFLENPDCYPTVDHIDRNILNNSISNLRWASHSTQAINREAKRGDMIHIFPTQNNSFRVVINRNSKKVVDKTFKTLDEAKTYRDLQLMT